MKCGLAKRQVRSMYTKVQNETRKMYGIGFRVPLRWDERPNASYESLARTHFPMDWTTRSGWSNMAEMISISTDLLPYVYEDEMMHIILHEFAHVAAGLEAQHDEPWKFVAEEMGTIPSPEFVLRNWEAISSPFVRKYYEHRGGRIPTMVAYGIG